MDRINIQKFLSSLEQKQPIKVLFTVENGSRTWQMENTSSSYNVHFAFYRSLKNDIALSTPNNIINTAFDEYADNYQLVVAGKSNYVLKHQIPDSFLQKLLIGKCS